MGMPRATTKKTSRPGPAPAAAAPDAPLQPHGTKATQQARKAIIDSIRAAVMDGRLPAGTKLREEEISRIFSATRNVVRDALAELKALGFVTLVPNRGAYVAQPTPEEVSDVFSARRIIEAGIFSELAQYCTARDIRVLKEHLALQDEANKRGDHLGLMRLLGEFHLLIARLNGNMVLHEILEKLISRTGLMTVLYQESHGQCAVDEHARLIEMLAAGKSAEAAEFVQQHLSGNRSRLVPKTSDAKVDVSAVLLGNRKKASGR